MMEEEPVKMILVLIAVTVVVVIAARFLMPYVSDWVHGLPGNEPGEDRDFRNLTDEELASLCNVAVAELGKSLAESWAASLGTYALSDVRWLNLCTRYDPSCKDSVQIGIQFKEYRDGSQYLIYFYDSWACRNLAKFPFDVDNPLWLKCTYNVGVIKNNKLSILSSAYRDENDVILKEISFLDLARLDGSTFFLNHYFCRDEEVKGNLMVAEIRDDNRIWFRARDMYVDGEYIRDLWIDTNLIVSGDKIYIDRVGLNYFVGLISTNDENKIKIPTYYWDLSIQLPDSIKYNIPSEISEEDYRLKILKVLGESSFSGPDNKVVYYNTEETMIFKDGEWI